MGSLGMTRPECSLLDDWHFKKSVEINQSVSSTYYVQRNKINICFLLTMYPHLEAALVLVLTLVFINSHISWRYNPDYTSKKMRTQRGEEAKFCQTSRLSDTPCSGYFNSQFTSNEPDTQRGDITCKIPWRWWMVWI